MATRFPETRSINEEIATWGQHPLLVTTSSADTAPRIGAAIRDTLPGLGPADRRARDAAHQETGLEAPAGRTPPLVIAEPDENDDRLNGNKAYPQRIRQTIGLAHQGVITLDRVERWSDFSIAMLYMAATQRSRIIRTGTEKRVRTNVRIIATTRGCGCETNGKSCTCSRDDLEAHDQRLWQRIGYMLFDITARAEPKNAWLSHKTLRERVQRTSSFVHSTRETPAANARLSNEQTARTARIRDPQAAALLQSVNPGPGLKHRILQVARSAADVSRHAFIEEKDVAAALQMTRHLIVNRNAWPSRRTMPPPA